MDGARRTRRRRLLPLLAALLKSPLKLLPPVALLKLLLLAALLKLLLLAALLKNPLKLPLPAVLLKLLPLVVLLKNPLRLPLPAVLLKLLPLVVLLTSRKKSPPPAALPVAPATSNRFFPPKTVPGGKILAGNLAYYSVLPIYDRNKEFAR